jgi:hypothetical protein
MDIYKVSQQTLKDLLESGADISVVGGWAVWAYNPYKFSLDIDIVLRPSDLWMIREKLLERGFNETSGGHLEKKCFKKAMEEGVIEVDAYEKSIGPFEASEVLGRSVTRELFGRKVKVASPTDLLILKLHALSDRRESGKGQKDISDLIALLLVARDQVDIDEVKASLPRKALKDAIALLTSSYQQTARFYPLSMAEYKRLKAALKRWMQ